MSRGKQREEFEGGCRKYLGDGVHWGDVHRGGVAVRSKQTQQCKLSAHGFARAWRSRNQHVFIRIIQRREHLGLDGVEVREHATVQRLGSESRNNSCTEKTSGCNDGTHTWKALFFRTETGRGCKSSSSVTGENFWGKIKCLKEMGTTVSECNQRSDTTRT